MLEYWVWRIEIYFLLHQLSWWEKDKDVKSETWNRAFLAIEVFFVALLMRAAQRKSPSVCFVSSSDPELGRRGTGERVCVMSMWGEIRWASVHGIVRQSQLR